MYHLPLEYEIFEYLKFLIWNLFNLQALRTVNSQVQVIITAINSDTNQSIDYAKSLAHFSSVISNHGQGQEEEGEEGEEGSQG